MNLTEAHRRAQLRIGALTVFQLAAVFEILDHEHIDDTFERWFLVVATLIANQRRQSANLAAAYLNALRQATVGEPFAAVLAEPVDEKALTTSMLVTGPYSLRRNLARKIEPAKAIDIAKARSSAAGMRHVLNAGRETIAATVAADPQARGYRRVTSANACEFCSTLAGRGPVYKSERTATFSRDGHHYHDGCACTAEPVYR